MTSDALVVAVLAAAWLGAGFCIGMMLSPKPRPLMIRYGYMLPPWQGDPIPKPAWLGRA